MAPSAPSRHAQIRAEHRRYNPERPVAKLLEGRGDHSICPAGLRHKDKSIAISFVRTEGAKVNQSRGRQLGLGWSGRQNSIVNVEVCGRRNFSVFGEFVHFLADPPQSSGGIGGRTTKFLL